MDTCGIPKQAKTFQSLRTPTCLQNSIPNFYQHLKNAKVLPHVLFKPPHPPKRFAFAGGKPTIWGSFFYIIPVRTGHSQFHKAQHWGFHGIGIGFPMVFSPFLDIFDPSCRYRQVATCCPCTQSAPPREARPPTSCRASSTTQRSLGFSSCKRRAQARPAKPAPTTTTSTFDVW